MLDPLHEEAKLQAKELERANEAVDRLLNNLQSQSAELRGLEWKPGDLSSLVDQHVKTDDTLDRLHHDKATLQAKHRDIAVRQLQTSARAGKNHVAVISTESEALAHRVAQLEGEMEKVNKDQGTTNTCPELDAARTENVNLKDCLHDLRASLKQLEEKEGLIRQRTDLQSRVEEAEAECATLREQCDAMKEVEEEYTRLNARWESIQNPPPVETAEVAVGPDVPFIPPIEIPPATAIREEPPLESPPPAITPSPVPKLTKPKPRAKTTTSTTSSTATTAKPTAKPRTTTAGKSSPKPSPRSEASPNASPTGADAPAPAGKPSLGAAFKGDGLDLTGIGPGSAAEAAGLQIGDLIVKWNGEPVSTKDGLETCVKGSKPKDEITLEVHRGGEVLTINVVMGQAKPKAKAKAGAKVVRRLP